MTRMRWDGENLEKIQELAYYTTDPRFEEKAAELFPNIPASHLRGAIDNLSRLRKIQRGNAPDKPPETVVNESAQDRQLARLNEEVARLRKLYKAQTSGAAKNEALLEAINSILPEYKPVPVPEPVKLNDDIEVEEMVLMLSDLHFGEVVSAEETGGISSFNLDIAKRRFDYTIEKAIVIAKEKQKGFHYRRLNVFLLGDLISGLIHDELRVSNEVGVVQQMLFAIEVIAPQILRLCQEFEEVHVASVVGNHGRVQEKYYFKGKANNNFDYLVAKMLERLTAGQPNLTWSVPESFWSVEEVAGKKFYLAHGEFVKSWNQIPFYGLSRAYLKWRVLCADYGIHFDHMLVAHFHNPNIFTMVRGTMLMNGSIKGGDEYSVGAISAACDPIQLMFAMNDGRHNPTGIWQLNSGHIK